MTKYVEDTYAKIARTYADRFFESTSDYPFIDILIKQLKSGSRVLDIGCGAGQFSKYLLEHGYSVAGIDSSAEMLAIARKRVPNGVFTEMDMRKLDYADESFGGALVAYSIIHIPTPELAAVLLEIRRIIKTDGFALFIAQEGEPDRVVDEPLAKGEKIFINFFTKERIADVLGAAGFNIISQATLGQGGLEDLSATAIGTLVTRA
jgi:ubiquinone/menaquinone biosynthesis C-methylase UbiE